MHCGLFVVAFDLLHVICTPVFVLSDAASAAMTLPEAVALPAAPPTPAGRAALTCASVNATTNVADAVEGCAGYAACLAGGRGYYLTCPDGQAFDQEIQQCEAAGDVQCGGKGRVSGSGRGRERVCVPSCHDSPALSLQERRRLRARTRFRLPTTRGTRRLRCISRPGPRRGRRTLRRCSWPSCPAS